MAILLQGAAPGVSFQTPQQKKQKQQILMFGGVLLAIAGVLYFGFFRGAEPAPTGGAQNYDDAAVFQGQVGATSTIVLTPEIVEILKQISAADLSVQDKRFGNLVIHGAFPIVAGEKGRKNPFEEF